MATERDKRLGTLFSCPRRAGFASLLLAGNAAGQGAIAPSGHKPTEAIRVEFDAPAECGNSGSFFAAVRARTDRVRPSEGGTDERRFSIRITTTSSGYEGRLSVIEPAGESSERPMAAETCAEVLDALSIVAALAVDPNAHEAETAAAPPAPTASADAAAAPVPTQSAVAEPVPAPEATPRAPPTKPDESRSSGPSSLSWFVGVQASLDVTLPHPLYFPTGALTADLTLERRSVVSPSIRLALGRSLYATASSPSGSASFAFTTFRVEPCPIRVRLSAELRYLPCVIFEGGLLTAEGHDASHARTRQRPWWAAGVAARLSIGSANPRVDVEVGARAALYRDTFEFQPSEAIYTISGLFPFVAAGISFGHAAEP